MRLRCVIGAVSGISRYPHPRPLTPPPQISGYPFTSGHTTTSFFVLLSLKYLGAKVKKEEEEEEE